MTGRIPKPARIRLVQGTGHRPIPSGGPKPPVPSGEILPPKYLKGEARKEFRRLGPMLQGMGALTEVDIGAFTSYCEAWARARKAEAVLADQGEIIANANGNLVKNPWLHVLAQAMKAMREIGMEFGLGPLSRGRLDVTAPAQKKDDGWSKLGETG